MGDMQIGGTGGGGSIDTAKLLEMIDTDKNGEVSKDELTKFLQTLLGGGEESQGAGGSEGAPAGGGGEEAGGAEGGEEGNDIAAQIAKLVEQIFSKLDKDGSGSIDQSEFSQIGQGQPTEAGATSEQPTELAADEQVPATADTATTNA